MKALRFHCGSFTCQYKNYPHAGAESLVRHGALCDVAAPLREPKPHKLLSQLLRALSLTAWRLVFDSGLARIHRWTLGASHFGDITLFRSVRLEMQRRFHCLIFHVLYAQLHSKFGITELLHRGWENVHT